MITQRGAALLVGAVLMWALGRLLGVVELYVVAASCAALVAMGAIAVRLGSATLAARRSVSTNRILGGGTAEVALQLRNESRIPAPLLLVSDACHYGLLGGDRAEPPRFVIAGIAPGRTTSLRYTVHGLRRGRYQIGPLRVGVRDPFGLTERTRRYSATDEVLVYPRVEALPPGLPRGMHQGSGSSEARRLFTSGEEFHTMREYVTGDDLRHVHWPSTARRQKLMVRQHEQPWEAEATIFCDTRAAAHLGSGAESTLEKAVSVAASLVWHLADHRYQIRLFTEQDPKPPAVAPWSHLLDRLATVGASPVPSLGPSLLGLRSAGASGLLAAVVAPPAAGTVAGQDRDLRALLQAGRGFQGKLAVVLDPGGRHSAGAREAAGLLSAAGWRAAALPVFHPLLEVWPTLTGGRAAAAVR
jgi:uncharacterized protein (DUF58 family)